MARTAKEQSDAEAKARYRADIVIQVRSGRLTAVAGAQALGVSKKTYYDWENKALNALTEALEDGEAGRPPKTPPDPRIAELETQNALLQAENQALRDQLKAQAMKADLATRQASLGKPRKRRGSS
jgi:transposase-like protein